MAVTLSGMSLLTTNDNEPNWNGTEGPDTYNFSIQGSNSESWQLSKNTTETGTLTRSASMPTSRGVYIVWMASSISAIYTLITLRLQSSTNNSRLFTIADSANPNVDGAFRAFAFDYVNKGTPTGTFNPAALTSSIWQISTANVNFRAVPNNWIDAIYYGAGHTISGTTTTNQVFLESWQYEYNTNTRRYGVLENYNGIIFCQADLILSGTNLVSNGETLVFATAPNGYDVYNLDITGNVSFENTSIQTAGTKLFNFDSTGATSFSMSGGVLEGGSTISFGSSDPISGVVISNSSLINIPNDPVNCSFLNNTLIVLSPTGTLNNSTIHASSASTVAVECADLAQINNCEFIGDGTGHAVEISTLGDGDIDWNSTTRNVANTNTGYATSDGVTGNETIFVNVSSGSLTIRVQAGATTPSIRTAGATVSVETPQPTLTITGLKLGSDVIIKESGTTTKLQDSQDVVTSSVGYTYSYTANTFVDIAVYSEGYIPLFINNYELPATSGSLPVSQVADRNYIP